ncbi:nicotinate mononucleotide-dependent phosphoribosyltransferase CobT [Acaryochloris marina NIES-2412]|uniref:nicotinate mononucleotide-dependent phosphoribosyltransferase CobT n=1 Tax=Acaryochloris marina TaxID=155978 RepID=UPI004059C97C
MLRVYTQLERGNQWLKQYKGRSPIFACVLGFTETGLIPNISTAGATPAARCLTALADAEFLFNGPQAQPTYPLPDLAQGVSPAMISWPIYTHQNFPFQLFNAGLKHLPTVPTVDLGGQAARCLSSGMALPLPIVEMLFNQGLEWGETLATQAADGYLILAECVVGGTTTAQGILTGLGYSVAGQVNSSHPVCNHQQKHQLVEEGLAKAGRQDWLAHPLGLVAAVGDPMQIVVAGMMLTASRSCGVMLAGGTQMLAVYALARQISQICQLPWYPDNMVVGTTRWVAEDPSGDTVALANQVDEVPLVATQLNFATSRYPQLQIFEQGFVKEGVGAGGCAIAAHLYQGWQQNDILNAVEQTLEDYCRLRDPG